jgi:hypothetical protein
LAACRAENARAEANAHKIAKVEADAITAAHKKELDLLEARISTLKAELETAVLNNTPHHTVSVPLANITNHHPQTSEKSGLAQALVVINKQSFKRRLRENNEAHQSKFEAEQRASRKLRQKLDLAELKALIG